MDLKKTGNKQQHDAFFRKAISVPEVAKEFFETNLPAHILKMVDLTTLKQQKETFVDPKLGRGTVDALFEVEFNNEAGYIYVLAEHQTKPDYWIVFRILKYILQICDHHLQKYPKTEHLPIVFPLIFYAGKEKYTAPLDIWTLFKDPELAKSILFDPFKVINLQTIDDEELKKKLWYGITSLVMKHIWQNDIFPFLQDIKPLLEEIANKNIIYMEAITWYILEEADSKKVEKIVEVIKEIVPENERGKIMTIADRLREEGFQLGEQRGIQLGKQEGIQLGKQEGIQLGKQRGIELGMKTVATKMLIAGQSIDSIVQLTSLTEEEVIKLKNNITH